MMPVGVPGPDVLGALGTIANTEGTVTGSVGRPEALYTVDIPDPLSEIHQGVLGPCTNPQAFFKRTSLTTGGTPVSDTRFV
jgi:hypothetical protein